MKKLTVWQDDEIRELTPEEYDLKAIFLKEETELLKTKYQRDRASAYPPAADYLDGIVKGDQAQIQAYINACLAVKAKYPKPGQPK
jgi:hypothetical protein